MILWDLRTQSEHTLSRSRLLPPRAALWQPAFTGSPGFCCLCLPPGRRATQPSAAGASQHGCYLVSSPITQRSSFPNRETSIMWAVKPLFEFPLETAMIIVMKQTVRMKAFIPAAQSSQ